MMFVAAVAQPRFLRLGPSRSGFPGFQGRVSRGLALVWLALVGTAVAAPAGDPLVHESKGVVVDWRRGVLVAHGEAAGDLRMPSADVARAGAQRRARNAGRARLGEALRTLPLGGGRRLEPAAIERALERAQAKRVEYQSNGGVLLDLEIAFGDWNDQVPAAPGKDAGATAAAPPPIVLRLTEGTLAAEPTLVVGEEEARLGSVRYALVGELPADTRPLVVHVDKKGRLVARDGGNPKELARKSAVIYVQKVLR
jgi:hypothetical protein